MPFVNGEIVDGYLLAGNHVVGGFAEVFETRFAGKRAAMKVLKPDADMFASGLFVQEGDIITEFQGHSRFPLILARGEAEGRPYLVFEWLDHPNIRGQVPADQKIKLLSQICEALSAAHEMKTIHRDVHPSNFKLTLEGNWKLIDWGVAYRPGSILESQPERLTGTYSVMPPEAFEGGLNDARSDLYSIGCCLFLYVAGRLPYGEIGGAAEFRELHQNAPIPQLANRGVDAPPDYQRLIDQLLTKDPARRIATAAAVRDHLLALPPLGR